MEPRRSDLSTKLMNSPCSFLGFSHFGKKEQTDWMACPRPQNVPLLGVWNETYRSWLSGPFSDSPTSFWLQGSWGGYKDKKKWIRESHAAVLLLQTCFMWHLPLVNLLSRWGKLRIFHYADSTSPGTDGRAASPWVVEKGMLMGLAWNPVLAWANQVKGRQLSPLLQSRKVTQSASNPGIWGYGWHTVNEQVDLILDNPLPLLKCWPSSHHENESPRTFITHYKGKTVLSLTSLHHLWLIPSLWDWMDSRLQAVNTWLDLGLEQTVPQKLCCPSPPCPSLRVGNSHNEHSLRGGLSRAPQWTVPDAPVPVHCSGPWGSSGWAQPL